MESSFFHVGIMQLSIMRYMNHYYISWTVVQGYKVIWNFSKPRNLCKEEKKLIKLRKVKKPICKYSKEKQGIKKNS